MFETVMCGWPGAVFHARSQSCRNREIDLQKEKQNPMWSWSKDVGLPVTTLVDSQP